MKVLYVQVKDLELNTEYMTFGVVKNEENPAQKALELAVHKIAEVSGKPANQLINEHGITYTIGRFDFITLAQEGYSIEIVPLAKGVDRLNQLRKLIQEELRVYLGRDMGDLLTQHKKEITKANIPMPHSFDFGFGSEYNDNDYDTVVNDWTFYDAKGEAISGFDDVYIVNSKWNESVGDMVRQCLQEFGIEDLQHIGAETDVDIIYPEVNS